MPKACDIKPKTLDQYCFYLSLDPPRIPLKKGDAREDSCPPRLSGGAPGGSNPNRQTADPY